MTYSPRTHAITSLLHDEVPIYHAGIVVSAIYRISGNFRCKNIFVVGINHEKFIHEIIFTRVNSYYSQKLSRC